MIVLILVCYDNRIITQIRSSLILQLTIVVYMPQNITSIGYTIFAIGISKTKVSGLNYLNFASNDKNICISSHNT